MSKKKNKQKKKELRVNIQITDIINALQLADQDIEELNRHMNEGIIRDTADYLSEILSDQSLTKNKIMFLSYMRGSIENNRHISIDNEPENFLDFDAALEFTNRYHSEDIATKFLESTLKYMSSTMALEIEDMEIDLKNVSDEAERKRKQKILDDVRKKRQDFDVNTLIIKDILQNGTIVEFNKDV